MDRFTVASVRARVSSAFNCLGAGFGCAWLTYVVTGAAGTSFAPFAVGFVVGSALSLPRVPRLLVTVDSRGLTIRNFFRTYVLSWQDIELVGWERFCVGGRGVSLYTVPVLGVWTRSDQLVLAQATWGLPVRPRERLVAAVTEAAQAAGVRVELTADDLRVNRLGYVPKHKTRRVSEIARGFR